MNENLEHYAFTLEQSIKSLKEEIAKSSVALDFKIKELQEICPHSNVIKLPKDLHRSWDSSNYECPSCGMISSDRNSPLYKNYWEQWKINFDALVERCDNTLTKCYELGLLKLNEPVKEIEKSEPPLL